jgi:isoquinoline 1-oxidoreductase alpha subunit
MIELNVNGQRFSVDVDPRKPLLWVLREDLQFTGTRFSCGKGLCGACSVHLDGKLAYSCQLPVSRAANRVITTIEGLSDDNSHSLQQAWLEENTPQCGYCQSGQLMAAAALLADHPQPTDEQIDRAMSGILCRCGTYPRIRKAIHRAAQAPVKTWSPERER